MPDNNTDATEMALQQSRIHEKMVDNYRTPGNENFYALAFDYIVTQFGARPGATVLDAGRGSFAKDKSLVDCGF